jgi:methylmalonyl-CoA mutase C-terminal domain/subunit
MHDRGIRVVASALRDAGVEVIFARYFMSEDIVKIAEQEDVDVIGISSYALGYLFLGRSS